jgi:hypothetical protein
VVHSNLHGRIPRDHIAADNISLRASSQVDTSRIADYRIFLNDVVVDAGRD